MSKNVIVTNIQRFSIHDGPGIRTTVFLNGCTLHCPWCANPENISPLTENYIKDGQSGVYGKAYTCDDLYSEIVKDRIFYKQEEFVDEIGAVPGGVTFSGGEPLMQFDALEPLLQRLASEQMHICVETCLIVPQKMLLTAIKYVDLFYVDIKILNDEKYRSILGGNLKQYLSNIELLFGAGKPLIFRVPVIGGYTDDDENVSAIVDFLKMYRPVKVELIKEHNLGKNKYITLGKTPLDLNSVTDEEMEIISKKIETRCGIQAIICKI